MWALGGAVVRSVLADGVLQSIVTPVLTVDLVILLALAALAKIAGSSE